jgi:phosphoglycolate phosphatase-like HAD superfamily hydrolase
MSDSSHSALDVLRQAQLVFWDFDGVVKDSVAVKTEAFGRLFMPYGADVARRVRAHHEANGGMSRFDKMPVYLQWAAQDTSAATVKLFCERFSELVYQGVIDAPWVPGVRAYLNEHHGEQPFVLLTATPQEEIEIILARCGIDHVFREVHGAPTSKSSAMADVLRRWQRSPADAVFIGDASADLAAAAANGVPFLLRRTPLNAGLQNHFTGLSLDDFEAAHE